MLNLKSLENRLAVAAVAAVGFIGSLIPAPAYAQDKSYEQSFLNRPKSTQTRHVDYVRHSNLEALLLNGEQSTQSFRNKPQDLPASVSENSIVLARNAATGELTVANDIASGLLYPGGVLRRSISIEYKADGVTKIGVLGFVSDAVSGDGHGINIYWNPDPSQNGVEGRVKLNDAFKSFLGTDTIPVNFEILYFDDEVIGLFPDGLSRRTAVKLSGTEFTSTGADFSKIPTEDRLGDYTQLIEQSLDFRPVNMFSFTAKNGRRYTIGVRYDNTGRAYDTTGVKTLGDFLSNPRPALNGMPITIENLFPYEDMTFTISASAFTPKDGTPSMLYAIVLPSSGAIEDNGVISSKSLYDALTKYNQDIAVNGKEAGALAGHYGSALGIKISPELNIEQVIAGIESLHKELGHQFAILPEYEEEGIRGWVDIKKSSDDIQGALAGVALFNYDGKQMIGNAYIDINPVIASDIPLWIIPQELYKVLLPYAADPGPEVNSIGNGQALVPTTFDKAAYKLMFVIPYGSLKETPIEGVNVYSWSAN